MSSRLRTAWLPGLIAIGVTFGCASQPVETQSLPHAAVQARHHLAEGNTGKPAAGSETRVNETPANQSSSAAGEAPSAPTQRAIPADLPDPAPLVTQHAYRVTVRYQRGAVSVESVKPFTSAQPVATSRRMGRYAFELWIGRELIDRVRFDFPLLGAAPAPNTDAAQRPNLAAAADVTRTIRVPVSQRATRARILDRATGVSVPVSWPPSHPGQPPLVVPGKPAP